MKNGRKTFIVTNFLILTFLFSPAKALAAYFTLEPVSETISPGQDLFVTVRINTEGEAIALGQASLWFDTNILQAQNIAEGDFFPINSYNIDLAGTGEIRLGGGLNPGDDLVFGEGILGTITFSGKNPGVSNLTFDCAIGGTRTSISKGSPNFEEFLDCAKTTTGSYEVLGPTPTPTPPGGATATPTPPGGATATPTPSGGTTPKPTIFVGGGDVLGLAGGVDTFTFALIIAVLMALSTIF